MNRKWIYGSAAVICTLALPVQAQQGSTIALGRLSTGATVNFVKAPSAIHNMIKTLERNGLIEKQPGQARSIRLLVSSKHLPRLT